MLLFQTPAQAPKWKRWLLYSPIARIVIFLLVTGALMAATLFSMKFAGLSLKEAPKGTRVLVMFGVQTLASILAYLVLVRFVEKRRVTELPLRLALPQAGLGIVYGALLITAVVVILWLAGAYQVDGTNPGASWVVPVLVGGIGAGVSEEIIFRGVLFRISEEGVGTWWALVISGLFFGLVHLGNKGATAWSAIAIAVEAGLLLGLLYHVTRSLWLCMGLHAGWNVFQGYVWGVPVSGTNEPGLLVSSRAGPDWLTGGSFGLEASVIAVLVNLAVALALLHLARRRGTLVPARHSAPIMEAAPAAS